LNLFRNPKTDSLAGEYSGPVSSSAPQRTYSAASGAAFIDEIPRAILATYEQQVPHPACRLADSSHARQFRRPTTILRGEAPGRAILSNECTGNVTWRPDWNNPGRLPQSGHSEETFFSIRRSRPETKRRQKRSVCSGVLFMTVIVAFLTCCSAAVFLAHAFDAYRAG
jgi:hypothetical protein